MLKDFLSLTEDLTKQLRTQSKKIADEAGRPVTYLEGFYNKEERVRQIRDQQGVADNGLIAVLSTLETCRSYDIYRNRETQQIDLGGRPRRALHHYFYFHDDKFGSVLRIETTLNDPKGLKVYRTKQSAPAASWHCCVRMA